MTVEANVMSNTAHIDQSWRMPETTVGRAEPDERLADDLLEGAAAIAEFLFPASSSLGRTANRRKVYHYASKTENRLPAFRIGDRLCARKSTLRRWIERQEGA